MLHKRRVWTIAQAESPEWLAAELTACTYCCCNGFRIGGYLFVNDATCADGAQEYAVLRSQGGARNCAINGAITACSMQRRIKAWR